jgi:hypothetical protein
MNKTLTSVTTAVALALMAGPAVAAPPSITSATGAEGTTLSVPVSHTCGVKKGCRYNVTTVAGTASAVNDFAPATFTGKAKKGGRFSITLPIATKDDNVAEPTETFSVHVDVSNRKGTFGFDAVQTITDNDAPTTPTPGPPPPDDNTPQFETTGTASYSSQVCALPYRFGVNYQYGAWGAFLSGCTVKLTCPVAQCVARSESSITPETASNARYTLNSRLFVQQQNGQSAGFNSNKSCDQAGACKLDDGVLLVNGQTAFSTCNGVRAINPAIRAKVACRLTLTAG